MGSNVKREQEEKYFAQEEQRKRQQLREKLNQERERLKAEKLKEAHFMKCPKCGHDLKEVDYEDVLVDICGNCGGVWLDKGELELLLEGRKAKGFLSGFLGRISKGG